jgi:hypothetical protein
MSQKTENFNPDRSWLGFLGSGRPNLTWQKCITTNVTEIKMEDEKNKKRIMCNSRFPYHGAEPMASLATRFYYSFYKSMVHSHLNHTRRPAKLSSGFCARRRRILSTRDLMRHRVSGMSL